MIGVTGLFRHPLKSHGREAVPETLLTAGQSLPFDRTWAVAHEASHADGTSWASCQNFSRAAQSPELMAIEASLDEATEQLTLRHPNQPEITFHPDKEADHFLEWVAPLIAVGRALPKRIHRLDGRGFTDADFPSVSICNMASHHAVEALAQTPLSQHRWRGNLWFDGAAPWEEFEWVGQTIRIGNAALRIEAPIDRCLATHANPETGKRDVDILRMLNILGHQDFGIFGRVIETGKVSVGDVLEVI